MEVAQHSNGDSRPSFCLFTFRFVLQIHNSLSLTSLQLQECLQIELGVLGIRND